MLDPWLEEHKDWVSKADGQGKDAIWYELEVPELVELHNGDKPIFGGTFTVYMTPMQKIQLYLESKNFDNLSHMVGGRSFVNKALYSKGKKDEAFGKLQNTIRLAPETVKKIVSDARYMAARKCGVSSVDYADFLEILDRVNENGGNPSQDEFEEAVRRADLNRSAAAAIWKIYWPKSSNCPW